MIIALRSLPINYATFGNYTHAARLGPDFIEHAILNKRGKVLFVICIHDSGARMHAAA